MPIKDTVVMHSSKFILTLSRARAIIATTPAQSFLRNRVNNRSLEMKSYGGAVTALNGLLGT